MPIMKSKNLISNVENTAKKVLGFKDVKMTLSGSQAVYYALQNAKVKKGTFVVLPTTICKSVVDVILSYGCFPLFCDVDQDFCLDYTKEQKRYFVMG